MKRTLQIFLSLAFSLIQLHAQEQNKYFPTGMKWKEVIAEPDYLPLDTTHSFIYEIGEDTIVRGFTCKKVFINKTPVKQWVYEEGEKIWIITEDYTEPILIYDFNWHGDNPVFFEQLRFLETSEKRIEKLYINQGDIKSVSHGGFQLEYILNYEGAIIRGIGKVSDLYTNGCLLGYVIKEPILPGIAYYKVLWIVRNGEEIFRSETADEWIEMIPDGIRNLYNGKSSPLSKGKLDTDRNNNCFDLSGRRLSTPPAKGVYIEKGRKKFSMGKKELKSITH